MFRGKESSNRIELSRLVQDLLNFGVLGSLRLWGGAGGWGASGGMGGVPTHMHMQVHARTHTHAHLYMYKNCKWPPTWRHPCLACLACLTCMCVRACACIHPWDIPPHTHTNPHPHPPICHPHGWVCGLVGQWVVGWVDGWLGGLMGGVRSNH